MTGLQETRSPQTRIQKVDPYFVVSSACNKSRNYGCEIWLDSRFKIDGCGPSFESVTIVHAEHQALLISVQYNKSLIYLLSFHAPPISCEIVS